MKGAFETILDARNDASSSGWRSGKIHRERPSHLVCSAMVNFRLSSPKFLIQLILLAIAVYGPILLADQAVLTDDGREVLLKQDGSWEFLSNDRFANTGDGRRVRLKADGSWEYMGNAPLMTSAQVRTTELDIQLQRGVIETHEVKVQKNTRVRSQTVFYVSLSLSPQAESSISIHEDDASLIRITDNKQRSYPVVSIHPGDKTLEPGSSTNLVIRADGSPQWWKNVKSIRLEFSPTIFGIEEPVTLIQQLDDIEKQKVDGFG